MKLIPPPPQKKKTKKKQQHENVKNGLQRCYQLKISNITKKQHENVKNGLQRWYQLKISNIMYDWIHTIVSSLHKSYFVFQNNHIGFISRRIPTNHRDNLFLLYLFYLEIES